VEGYSKEFIDDILSEISYTPQCALEPFCGSGTTPVELQARGIKCYSFEVSPFMFLLAETKMDSRYNPIELQEIIESLRKALESSPENIRVYEKLPFGPTVVNDGKKKKYNFHNSAIDGLLDVRYAIKQVVKQDYYRNLCLIAMASIIMEASNMFRNGKCLSYRKGWLEKALSRRDIHDRFLQKLSKDILEDVQSVSSQSNTVNNSRYCIYGDVRANIGKVPADTVDLIITSPPYLNSRDYTDIYMLELKVLELTRNYDELRQLRERTIRSHVQVRYDTLQPIDNERLIECVNAMKAQKDVLSWNADIINMVCGYFEDMQELFKSFRRVMRKGGKIYFNVANSAYFGVEVPVDLIVSDIAEAQGFVVQEIRKARDLKTSPQQKGKVSKLRESVIVIEA
jgi:DNA modification methylase